MRSHLILRRHHGHEPRPRRDIRPAPRLALFAALASATFALPAQAILFASPLVYQEDFAGESSFPTTPELDIMASGGLVPSAASATPPILTGSSARFDVTFSDTRDGVFLDIDDEEFSTVEANVGLRGEYSGLATTSPGEAWIGQVLRFTRDDDLALGGTLVAMLLQLTQHDGFSSARLLVVEERIGPGFVPDYLDIRTTILPLSTAADLFAGTAFTLDLEVDPTAATAIATIAVGSDPEISSPNLPLIYAQDYALSSTRQYFEHRGVGDPFVVELDRMQLFADPSEFVPLFNIDVGTFWGTPSNSYAAAGSPGFWNTLTIGANALSDVDGLPTATTATLTAASLGLIEANGGETRDLLADWAADPTGWAVDFSGLDTNGAYRVRAYTMGSGIAESGALLANGEPHETLPGVVVPSLVEGDSFAVIDTLVSNTTLSITGTPTLAGLPPATHLAGLQIETTRSLPEPGFAVGIGAALVALTSVVAGRRRKAGAIARATRPLWST